ncbi:MAG: flagellin [Phycisphaerales bacterium]
MSMMPIGRVTNLLTASTALSNLGRTNLALYRLQGQMASGVAVGRFSDDAVKAALISVLDERLERSGQTRRNLDHAEASLNVLDQALGEANETMLEAKGIASAQVGLGSSAAERASQAEVVNSLIQSMLGTANRQGVAGSVFGGATPGEPAVRALFAGYRYVGQGGGLMTDTGLGVPITIGGANPIGRTSARVKGDVDLDPSLTADTRLADLSGARGVGVTLGQVEFSFDGGPRTVVDLSGADSVEDVILTLTHAIKDYETANSVTILGPGGVSIDDGGLSIDVAPSGSGPDPQLQFFDPTGGSTAADLGLAGDPPMMFQDGTSAGLELDAHLTWRTPVTALRGVTGPLGSLRISSLGQTRDVDLSGAATLADVRNLIEGTGLGLRVEITEKGIDVYNEVAAGKAQGLSIAEVSGENSTATRLGIRTLTGSTRIADFNDGRGVSIAANGFNPSTNQPDPTLDIDFEIKLGDGRSFTVDLRSQDMATVQTVLDRINAEATNAGITVPGDFEAGLSDGENGLVLTQASTITGAITVGVKNNSPAAEQLGLLAGTYASGSFRAEDRAKVRVDNVFTNLIDLRDSLLENNTVGITLAGEKLEESVDGLAQSRALVGGYAKRVEDGQRRQEDLDVLDETTRSGLRDVDYAEAAVRLSLLQTQLQAGLATTAQSLSRSLLDFLG